jgi:hypothetical protein
VDNSIQEATADKGKAPGGGFKNKILFVAGIIITIALVIMLGTTVYTMFFQPVWTEQLSFKNSTGQYESIIFYRNATNPTYANLSLFLATYGTGLEGLIYNDTSYKCVEYAVILHDDAEEQGINCSLIGTDMDNGIPGHALVEFSTKDKGTVYADPTSMNVSGSNFDNISMDSIILMRDHWKQQFPVADAVNKKVQVVEYRNASVVSFAQLEAFLGRDNTETAAYDYPNYTCADFATTLFDRAEIQGIKCGIVAIQFYNMTDGHAFEAFPTTDRGIVYIDDTGINASQIAEGYVANDNVVYLQAGSELGELPLDQVNGSLDYSFYTQREDEIQAYTNEWAQYESDYENYTSDLANYQKAVNSNDQYYASYQADCKNYDAAVAQYNSQMDAHNDNMSVQAPTNLAALEAWDSRLDQEYQNYSNTWNSLENTSISLNSRREGLNDIYNSLMSSEERNWISYYPIGIVKDISVYW